MKFVTLDDNVLLGQGHRASHEVVVDEKEERGRMMISRGKLKNSEKNLLQCHFVHHECHFKSPGVEPESPRTEQRLVA
jgi:hypothetical protein